MFRRGAFAGMFPVIPVVCEIKSCGPVYATYESTTFMQLITLLLSSFTMHRITIRVLPPFAPNQYLEETHIDKGPEPWKIFAGAVEEIIREKGNFKKVKRTHAEIMSYQAFMAGETDEMQLNGVVYKGSGEKAIAKVVPSEEKKFV